MASRSPTLEGFRAILRRPSFGLAEIAWRWSFGAAVTAVLAGTFAEYLNTLPVTRGDLLLLQSRHPFLVSQALRHILRGSGLRVVEALLVQGLCLAVGWVVVAALARAAITRDLLHYFGQQTGAQLPQANVKPWRLRSLLELNSLRVGTSLAAAVGCLAALRAGGAVSPDSDPSPGSAFFVTLCIGLLVWLAWSAIHWFLSLASIFVVAQGRDTFSSVTAAVDLCGARAGAIFAVGSWFGLAHVVLFVIATSVVAVPMSVAPVLPAAMTFGGVLLVTLLYFAVVDFLYAGRLAAYVAILTFPKEAPAVQVASQPLLSVPPGGRVDQDELILGDLPVSG